MADEREKVEAAAAEGRDLKEILGIVIEEARRFSGAESCSVIMLDHRKKKLVFFVVGGKQERPIEEISFPAKKGIAGHVVETGQGQFVNDPNHDPRFYDKIEKISGLDTKNILATPLYFQGEIIGALEILNKPGGFEERDLIKLEQFAQFAGEVIGKSKKLADEIKTGEYLEKKFEATAELLLMYKR